MRLKKSCSEAPMAQTKYGKIRGRRLALVDGKEINAFLGVPFARPPLGELRFKKPEPPEPWTTVLDTRSYKGRAIQKNYIWDQLETGVGVSEDCLYLNVVAPASPSSEFPDGYPILFYIHGGGYIIDTASKYNYKKLAKNLVSKNVIVVTVEYRLGYLGFLCLDEKQAKGNYGVWDCVEALKFVKENAQAFNGNPNMITVSGQSAGSCLSDLLSLSPVSRDLFQQKILMAGFSQNSWAITKKQLVIDFCRAKALKLGFQRTSESKEWSEKENAECIKFLQQVPSRVFAMTMLGDKTIINEMRLLLTPVLDDELFPRSIEKLRQEASPKSSLAGITKHEGLLFLALGRRMANRKFLEFCENKVDTVLKTHFPPDKTSNSLTLAAYQELYGINELIRKDKRAVQRVCVDVMSDLINGIGIHKHCVQSAKSGSTCYRYVFDQQNSSLTTAFNLFLPFTGPTHGTELAFLFGVNIFVSPFLKTKADRRVIDVMTSLFTNFVKYGNPNGSSSSQFKFDWKPVSNEHPDQHLVISDNAEFKEQLEINRYEKLVNVLDAMYATLSAPSS